MEYFSVSIRLTFGLLFLQFSTILQSLQRQSSNSFECVSAVWRDVGDGDNSIYYDHFSTMARLGVRDCGRLTDIHIDLFVVAHVERRGFGVRMMMSINSKMCTMAISQ